MTPAQFLKNLLPYSGALLGLYALVMEKATFHELTLPAAQGGLGMHGMMIFGLRSLLPCCRSLLPDALLPDA